MKAAAFCYVTPYSLTLCKKQLSVWTFNALNAELNPIRHLLALVGARHIVHVRRVRVKTTCLSKALTDYTVSHHRGSAVRTEIKVINKILLFIYFCLFICFLLSSKMFFTRMCACKTPGSCRSHSLNIQSVPHNVCLIISHCVASRLQAFLNTAHHLEDPDINSRIILKWIYGK